MNIPGWPGNLPGPEVLESLSGTRFHSIEVRLRYLDEALVELAGYVADLAKAMAEHEGSNAAALLRRDAAVICEQGNELVRSLLRAERGGDDDEEEELSHV